MTKQKLPKTHKQLEALLAEVKAEGESFGFSRGKATADYPLHTKLKAAEEYIASVRAKDETNRRHAVQGLSNMADAMAKLAHALSVLVEPRQV